MKKLLALVAVLLVAVLMTQTVPDRQAHKEAMLKAITAFVDEEASEKGFGDNVLTDIGKGVIVKTAEVALNTKLRVNNYYLFNTTYVRLKGKDQLLSVGVFGHVFTFDKEMLREKLQEALEGQEEALTEKEEAKLSAKELRRLKKEQRKQEKALEKERKRQEAALAKEKKRQEKEARRDAKRREKERQRLERAAEKARQNT
ncbi:MAG: hypothetical protein K6A32_04735 [Bacteroidales bacterium]|nr:hypothetical protein [Bacteroidales bacterium]